MLITIKRVHFDAVTSKVAKSTTISLKGGESNVGVRSHRPQRRKALTPDHPNPDGYSTALILIFVLVVQTKRGL